MSDPSSRKRSASKVGRASPAAPSKRSSTRAATAAAGVRASSSSVVYGRGATDEKASRGLRHFSMKVCRKVEAKGSTTYNEVADELVKEVMAERSADEPRGKYDEKNIRRRVYDALNVLMAMDIISKEKKEIHWKGLPSNVHHDLDMLQREAAFRRSEVERKRESLRELLVQQVCFRNLVQHNQSREAVSAEEKIPLPFIIVNTNKSAVIQCEMSPDRSDVMFDFSLPFEINDDNTILKRLGMNKTSLRLLEVMLPPDLLQYCKDHGLLDSILSKEPSPEPAVESESPPPPHPQVPPTAKSPLAENTSLNDKSSGQS